MTMFHDAIMDNNQIMKGGKIESCSPSTSGEKKGCATQSLIKRLITQPEKIIARKAGLFFYRPDRPPNAEDSTDPTHKLGGCISARPKFSWKSHKKTMP